MNDTEELAECARCGEALEFRGRWQHVEDGTHVRQRTVRCRECDGQGVRRWGVNSATEPCAFCEGGFQVRDDHVAEPRR